MFHSMALSSKHVFSYARNATNLIHKQYFNIVNRNHRKLPENNVNMRRHSSVDRPHTDNLLMSPDNQTLSSSNNNNVEQLTKLGQNDDLMKNKLQDTLILSPAQNSAMLKKTEGAVSLEEVPGPQSLKVISDAMKNIPIIGMQTVSSLLHGVNHFMLTYGTKQLISRNIKPFNMLFDTYGDIVCLRVPFCGDILLVQKPEHISEIYKQRNLNSVTYSSFDSLSAWHSKQSKRNIDLSNMFLDAPNIHLFSETDDKLINCVDDGDDYPFPFGLNLTQDVKDILQDNYEAKQIFWSSSKYHNGIVNTTDEFVKKIYSIRNIHEEVPNDFDKELNMWGIECMMQTLFGTDLGFYKSGEIQVTNEAQRVLTLFTDATTALQRCETGLQLWRIFNTRSWEKLSLSCDNLESFLMKHIRMSKLRLDIALKMVIEKKDIKESSQIIKSSLVKALILSGAVTPEQILTLCIDMMLIGVSAASTSLGFIFYHLAKSLKSQDKLFNEVAAILPSTNSELDLNQLQDAPYLHACITESLRLKHPIPYSLMRLPTNMMLQKYFIPAGTYVMTANEVSCLKEDNFDEAEKFKPERWLDQTTEKLQDAVVPLSEGTRSFLGRDWLRQQLAVATAKVIRNFHIEYHYGEIKTDRKILSKPNRPLKFTFIQRSN